MPETNSAEPNGLSRGKRIVLLRFRLVPWVAGIITLLATLGHRLNNIPLNRLFELNICRQYYSKHDPSIIGPGGDIAEELCKENNIQEQLAFIIGLISTLELVCELFSSIPLGYISDKVGRKFVLTINTTAAILAITWYISVAYFYKLFPLEAVIAAPSLFLFAGFVGVLGANLNAICADVADGESQRTKIFAYTQSTSQIVQFIGPALSSTAMKHSLWLPFWLGIGCLVLIYPNIAILPETRPAQAAAETESLLHAEEDESAPISQPLENGNAGLPSTVRKIFINFCQQLKDFKTLFTSNLNYGCCLAIFFFNTLQRATLNVLVLYISKRYNTSLATAGYILSLKAFVNFMLFTAIIPGLLSYLTLYKNLSGTSANLIGLKISNLLLILGLLLVSFSADLWMLGISFVILSLGYGVNLFTLSIISNITIDILGESHMARTYAAVAFVETLALLLGIPIMTGAWVGGISIGGWGLVLPWLIGSGFCVCMIVPIWLLKPTLISDS